ncbi:helix-turn-helix domain-containing protein [Aquamicrobium zhengzhouense]|uniref:Helix-turn-helix transcriptional regulator n=1 Tax=Aquamicrobium zhengzhouense TaxID=2781738 RepID=A0ABS0SGM5_9HYPH|nr:helix-turn-helix transcriptional regulator [Aquamicrobium zhengzhouense]MBI1621578.1 helix-turn-helix transcriptional regulator [Aquamicrobium zhengzhouense]
MAAIVESITAALSSGVNVITALRDAYGYSIEDLSTTSGLAVAEVAELEAGNINPEKLARLTSSLGLPENVVA